MSRRDTIIIAVLINTGLLAILFMMAINIDEDHLSERIDIQSALVQVEEPQPVAQLEPVQAPRDELDFVIQDLAVAEKESKPESKQETVVKKEPAKPAKKQNEVIEITVKRGDSLDKIAHANGTNVSTLMSINHLTTDRIKIGQTLQVPVGQKKQVGTTNVSKAEQSEPEYYTIQNGDNPWKIAKKFHVRFDELLKLNGLDEAKARRLQAGDKLRVR